MKKKFQRSQNKPSDGFEGIQETILSQESDSTEREHIELWEALDSPDLRKERQGLTKVAVSAWLICLAIAIVRYVFTGEYLAVVAILALLLAPVGWYYYRWRMKGESKRKD